MSASATYYKWREEGDDDEGNRQSLLHIIMSGAVLNTL